ncbi:putative nucleotide-diphospho-sugar transferase [Stenomitos frigidus]|nr:putative nucleotide-diphospho-sugar transferase [Stenomitos frigidus]
MALRQQEPALPITLLSDHPFLTHLPLQDYGITPRLLDRHEVDQQAFSSRSIKTRLNAYSPYQETLFLDADILPLQPVADLWADLNESDLAMVVDRLPMVSLCDHIAQEEKAYTLQRLPGNTVQFNSGVILWRDSLATQALFQQWHKEWQQFQKHDQLALIRAIKAVQIPVMKLPMTYNISPMDAAPLMGTDNGVHLLHCWGGMVASGAYRQFAKQYYPLVVETVAQFFADDHFEDLAMSNQALSYTKALLQRQTGEPIEI